MCEMPVGGDMRIKVNGEYREHDEQMTVVALLESLKLDARRVAVELNRQILPRARYGLTHLAEADELEIVTLVGGG